MTDFTCPECKGSGVYKGFNTVEPCKACGGKIGKSVIEYAAECAGMEMSHGFNSMGDFARAVMQAETGGPVDGRLKDLRQEGFPFPIVTPQNSDFYCRVFDASGVEYHDVVSINLQTGEIEQFARDGFGSIVIENNDVKRLSTKIQTPIRLEKTGQRHREKPFDEIMPAELEAIEIGQCVKVNIEYEDWPRVFLAVCSHISRPLFGLPANSFKLKSISSVPNGNNPKLSGELIYSPRTELDRYANPCDTCQDMLFIPILED